MREKLLKLGLLFLLVFMVNCIADDYSIQYKYYQQANSCLTNGMEKYVNIIISEFNNYSGYDENIKTPIVLNEINNIQKDPSVLLSKSFNGLEEMKELMPGLLKIRNETSNQIISEIESLNRKFCKEVKNRKRFEKEIDDDKYFLLIPPIKPGRLQNRQGTYHIRWSQNGGDYLLKDDGTYLVYKLIIKNETAIVNWGIDDNYESKPFNCMFINPQDDDFFIEIPVYSEDRIERIYYYFNGKDKIKVKRYWVYPDKTACWDGDGRKVSDLD